MFISEHIKNMKELNQDGRCLHFDSGERCDRIIGAHSIQKSGQLKEIIEENHVIHIDAKLGSLVKNDGGLSVTLISWNKVSTFNGFCQTHDNQVFEPIDNSPLIPTDKQVMLYAYRSVCREYFVKENAYELAKKYLNHPEIVSSFLMPYYIGIEHGFKNLKLHKDYLDKSLSGQSYSDIVYVSFMSSDSWNTQFSGVLYPDFDFLGNQLQNLGNLEKQLDLITFFTAPTNKGWAFVFAWHKSSNNNCCKLLSSLAEAIHRGNKTEDCIFRFSVSCCENHAFRPSWWKGLSSGDQEKILNVAHIMVEPEVPIPNTYIAKGLEGVASWSFPDVISTM